MAHLLAQHSFQGISGIAEDRYVNTFHFEVADGYSADKLEAISNAVRDFYTAPASVIGVGLGTYMSGLMDTEGHTVKIYDMADLKPRAPRHSEVHPFSGSTYGGGNPLPEEVAVCLSFASAPESGTPAARLRGRIYIGPLSTSAMPTPTSNNPSRPDSTMRQVLVQLAADLAAQVATDLITWCVYSGVDSELRPVVRAWSDNGWDTQRRRGRDATDRESLVF